MGYDIYPALLLACLDLGVDASSGYEPLCDKDGCPHRAAFARGDKRVCGQHAILDSRGKA